MRKKYKTKKEKRPKIIFIKEFFLFRHSLAEWDKKDTILIVILLLAGFLLRFYPALTQSFWVDELSTIQDSRNILNVKIFQRAHYLSFLFVRLALLLGEREITVRLPSLIFGIALIPLFYLFSFRLAGRGLAIISSILLILSPYHIYFSKEARYYTEIAFFSFLAFYFLVLFLTKKRIIHFILFLIFNAVNLGIHPTTYVFFISTFVFAILIFIFHLNYKELLGFFKAQKTLTVLLGIFLLVCFITAFFSLV